MNARLLSLISTLALFASTQAGDSKEEGRYLAKPLKGDYYLYGGSIGDKSPPTQKDSKLSMMLTGALAKDLFDHIGQDAKEACGADKTYRERNRGDLTCTLTKQHGYSCYLGLDMSTGKSVRGSTC